ncbi:MAG: amidase, partial [Candidatus Hydrogenedentes bacterium]|nr:amidase [Candidatus Hydrogenedentota bacterium]
MDVHGLTLTTIADLIRSGQHTSEEITRAYLERIDRYNPILNAYLHVFEKQALAQAAAMDREVASGKIRGPLHGVPIAVKDIIDIEGTVTTAGGVLLPDVPAAEDAPVIARLRDAGAVILGKLNLHEYAWGGTTNNPHYGHCFNPWKEGYSPGGSSGGAGAAVSAGLCAAALGTDTLGSVRIPSSYCGCVGIKPTARRVSNRGVYPLSWSMDNVGLLTRRVQDAAAV